MRLEDIPDLKGNQYPARISVSLSSDAKSKLDSLKKSKGKDTAEVVRRLIDEFLSTIDFEEAV